MSKTYRTRPDEARQPVRRPAVAREYERLKRQRPGTPDRVLRELAKRLAARS